MQIQIAKSGVVRVNSVRSKRAKGVNSCPDRCYGD